MKTYPIFEAKFGGSSDYMAMPTVSIAAVNITQAVKIFREIDAARTGTWGTIGNLVYKNDAGQWVRPMVITTDHIRRNTDIRATWADYWSIKDR